MRFKMGEKLNSSELISVVIPCYNEEMYISKSVNSIRNQTYKNLEIIIVDDNSTDSTCDIVERIAEVDERVKLIKKNANSGPAISLNIGIKASLSSRFVVRMDADDYVFPSKIERQYYLMKDNSNMVACGTAAYYINYKTDEHRLVIFPQNNDAIKKMLRFSDLIQSGAAMYKKDALERVGYFDEENPKAEAMRIALKLSKIGDFGNLLSPEYVYFTRKGNSNRSADGNYKKRNIAYSQITKEYAKTNRSISAYIASQSWFLYHLVPRCIQVWLRNLLFKTYINIPINKQEVKVIEAYYDNL